MSCNVIYRPMERFLGSNPRHHASGVRDVQAFAVHASAPLDPPSKKAGGCQRYSQHRFVWLVWRLFELFVLIGFSFPWNLCSSAARSNMINGSPHARTAAWIDPSIKSPKVPDRKEWLYWTWEVPLLGYFHFLEFQYLQRCKLALGQKAPGRKSILLPCQSWAMSVDCKGSGKTSVTWCPKKCSTDEKVLLLQPLACPEIAASRCHALGWSTFFLSFP